MNKDLNTFFEEERKEEKTFREIKIALKELLHDTKKENRTKEKTELIQKSKEKIENNIIENLKEGLKILSGDYLYPLKYLTTYNTVFNFSKNAENIFPGDILKLEGEKLVILRNNEKINIGTITKKVENKNTKNSPIIPFYKENKQNINKQSDLSPLQKKSWEKESSKYLKEIDELDYSNLVFSDINAKIEKKEINQKAREIFEKFSKKLKIPNLSKNDILQITNNDYIKAITILLIYKNEQASSNSGIFSRKNLKNFAREIDKQFNTEIVDSIGQWQIKPNSIGNDELKLFFKEDIDNFKFTNKQDKELFHLLRTSYLSKNKLSKEQKIKLLENKNLSSVLVGDILKIREIRTDRLLKKTLGMKFNKQKLDYKSISFYTSLLANSYHMGPAGAVRGELFTDISLKIAEKLGILEKTKSKIYMHTNIISGYIEKQENYQNEIRNKYSGLLAGLIGKTNFYERNTEIQKKTISLILEYIEKNNFLENKPIYLKNELSILKEKVDDIRKNYIPKEISIFITNLANNININPVNFTQKDYKNTNPQKAILVANYGANAWRGLEKNLIK